MSTEIELFEHEVEIDSTDEPVPVPGVELIPLGPLSAEGVTTCITVMPSAIFRGEKMIVNDVETKIGEQPVDSLFALADNTLGNGIKWDTVERALEIAVTISFVESCTFDMTIFGKSVI